MIVATVCIVIVATVYSESIVATVYSEFTRAVTSEDLFQASVPSHCFTNLFLFLFILLGEHILPSRPTPLLSQSNPIERQVNAEVRPTPTSAFLWVRCATRGVQKAPVLNSTCKGYIQ